MNIYPSMPLPFELARIPTQWGPAVLLDERRYQATQMAANDIIVTDLATRETVHRYAPEDPQMYLAEVDPTKDLPTLVLPCTCGRCED